MTLKLEHWKSTNGKVEHHYFLPLSLSELYVVGFNPDILSPEARRRILRTAELDIERREKALVTPAARTGRTDRTAGNGTPRLQSGSHYRAKLRQSSMRRGKDARSKRKNRKVGR